MNRDVIAQRCLVGGTTVHQAAIQAGADPFLLLGLGDGPATDERTPIGTLLALARLLDLSLDELVDGRPDLAHQHNDLIRVEAALAAFPDGLTRDQLADAFNWPYHQVERAIAALQSSLRGTGRSVRAIADQRYVLGPNLSALTVDEHTRLQRSLPANQHLDVEHTTILRFILDGWDSPGWAKAARTTVKRLVDTGLVEPGRHYTPTPEVAFSLRLDDEPYNSDY